MQQFDSVLSQSIHQYERILDFMQKMDDEMGTAETVALQNFSNYLNELQNEAMRLDQIIAQFDQKSLKTETMQRLFTQRERLLKEILLLNERIIEKGSRVKSLIAHEMEKFRAGLSALGGYKQQQHQHQGRIINGTS